MQPEIPKPNWLTYLLVGFLRIAKFFRGLYHIDGLRKRSKPYEHRKPKLPLGISHERQTLAGLTCDRLATNDGNAGYAVLHLYGGGGCVRMPSMEMPSIAQFCQRIKAQAFLPWYRLAPEHNYLEAAEDCVAAYQAVLEQGINPSKLILSGSSAGGGYVFTLLGLIKQRQLPMPACAVLLSPSGDCLMVGESWHENARRDPIFHIADVLYCQNLLLSPEQIANPLINVSLVENFKGYPPMYFCASSTEVLRDVAVIAHEKAQAAGITSQLDIFSGGIHCLPLQTYANQSKAIWQRIDHFVLQHLKQ